MPLKQTDIQFSALLITYRPEAVLENVGWGGGARSPDYICTIYELGSPGGVPGKNSRL